MLLRYDISEVRKTLVVMTHRVVEKSCTRPLLDCQGAAPAGPILARFASCTAALLHVGV